MNNLFYLLRHIYSTRDYFHYITLKIVICIAIPCFLGTNVFAQPIGIWTFNNVLTGTAGAHNTVSVADFSASVPTHAFNGGTEYYGENGWPTGALNTSDYLEFSLTPSAGYQLDISSVVIVMRRSNTGSPAGSGPTNWAMRSSLDGFTTNISSGTMTHTYSTFTITPGASFLNLHSTVTFRVYGYNVTVGTGGNSRLVVDNLTVNGLGYVLATQIKSFSATARGTSAVVKYSLSDTQVSDKYELERSTDGSYFSPINKNEETVNYSTKEYSFTDNNLLAGVSAFYYRLHVVASNGKDIYSSIALVVLQNNRNSNSIHTRIAHNSLYINGTFTSAGKYELALYTVSGQILFHSTVYLPIGNQSLVFPINIRNESPCILKLVNSMDRYSAAIVPVN